MEDAHKNIPRIYVTLENGQANYQCNMIEGMIVNQPNAILIDLGENS